MEAYPKTPNHPEREVPGGPVDWGNCVSFWISLEWPLTIGATVNVKTRVNEPFTIMMCDGTAHTNAYEICQYNGSEHDFLI